MTANSLVKPAGFGLGDEVSSVNQFQPLQVQAAQSINRTNTHTGWRAMPICPIADANPGRLVINSTGEYETASGDAAYHVMPLIGLPNGHTLTAVRLWIIPANAARSSTQPEYMPILYLYKKASTLSSGTPTTLGSFTATGGSESAYEAGQAMLIDGLTETIDLDSNAYYLVFRSEDGAAAYPGLQLGGLDAQVTCDTAYGGQDFTHWRKDATP